MDFIRLESVIKDISGSVSKGDVIATYSEGRPVDFEMDKLKSIEDISKFSIGLRVFDKGRVGNSFINSIDDRDILIRNAYESSGLGDEIDLELPSQADYMELKTFYPSVNNYPAEKAIRTGEDIIKRLKEVDEDAKISINITPSFSRYYLANTSGFWGTYEETHLGISAGMLLVEEGGGLLSVDDGDASYDDDIDTEEICSNIEWRYRNALRKATIGTGYYPVLFSPEALWLLLESIEIAANGKTLYKGISVFADKMEKEIASPSFDLYDDPSLCGGLGSYPFDDEGIVPMKLPIIEKGVFKNFIYDLTTAKRLKKKSTGHAARSAATLPSPSFSNLIMGTGYASFEEMIGSIEKGLYVCEFLGGGMSNILAGDFSVNVELGYLIEDGRVKGRLKDIMLSGNVYDLLKNILSIESRTHKKGSLYAPHMLFGRASVTG